MRKWKNGLLALLSGVLLPVAVVAVLLWFATAVESLNTGRAEEDMRQLEEALRRGCVACYAAEGAYPTDLNYLKERYGIQIDEGRYTVYYSAFAENIMPDITVLENTP